MTLQLLDTYESARPSLPFAPPIDAGTAIALEWRDPSTGLIGFSLGVDPASVSYSVPEPALAPLALLALLVPFALARSRVGAR